MEEGSYQFWKTVFDGVATCGRRVEIDMHAKGMDQTMTDTAVATGLPIKISPKYWAEHFGMPYHQADIREVERPKAGRVATGLMKFSAGSRSFLRYGYGDLLREDRKWGVLHRIWPGTQRLLLWGDPLTAAAHSRAFSFCGSDGVEIMEPLSFKGRRGSGIAGNRTAYADASLAPRWDWEKYEYGHASHLGAAAAQSRLRPTAGAGIEFAFRRGGLGAGCSAGMRPDLPTIRRRTCRRQPIIATGPRFTSISRWWTRSIRGLIRILRRRRCLARSVRWILNCSRGSSDFAEELLKERSGMYSIADRRWRSGLRTRGGGVAAACGGGGGGIGEGASGVPADGDRYRTAGGAGAVLWGEVPGGRAVSDSRADGESRGAGGVFGAVSGGAGDLGGAGESGEGCVRSGYYGRGVAAVARALAGAAAGYR